MFEDEVMKMAMILFDNNLLLLLLMMMMFHSSNNWHPLMLNSMEMVVNQDKSMDEHLQEIVVAVVVVVDHLNKFDDDVVVNEERIDKLHVVLKILKLRSHSVDDKHFHLSIIILV